MAYEYDYEHQAWTRDGRYIRCGHRGRCVTCYGSIHEGKVYEVTNKKEGGVTTETELQIREVENKGITIWYALGKVDEQQFLLALLEQFNERVTERVRDGCRVPQLSDVAHQFGMATTCIMDGLWSDADLHPVICEDPATCNFDISACEWMTVIQDESLAYSAE